MAFRLEDFAHKYLGQARHAICVSPPGFRSRLWMRTGSSSDHEVIRQFVYGDMFRPLANLKNIRTIVDCGANCGYSSVWFLETFPVASVWAVEPDTANAEFCRFNLKHFKSRTQVLEAAVWGQDGLLAIAPGVEKDIREWARVVHEIRQETPEHPIVKAVTIPQLIAQAGGHIDLLKIDVEWAELNIFAQPANWLENVSHLVIELHDEDCRRTFFASISGFDFDLTNQLDLTICTNIRRKSPEGAVPVWSTNASA